MENETVNAVNFTEEEIAARKEEMLKFYAEQIEFMKVQYQFEKLSADIEDERLRRLVAMLRQAQLQAPPAENEEEEPSTSEAPKKRNLKTTS